MFFASLRSSWSEAGASPEDRAEEGGRKPALGELEAVGERAGHRGHRLTAGAGLALAKEEVEGAHRSSSARTGTCARQKSGTS